MDGDTHDAKTQEEPQTAQSGGQQQAAQDEPQVSGKDWEKAITERDGRIAVNLNLNLNLPRFR